MPLFLDMDQSWYIPRPSLSSNSSKVQSRFYHRDSEVLEKTKDCNDCNTTLSSASSKNSKNKKNQMQETCIDNIECDSPIKRGSRSSQGSSDSEQSIHVCCIFVLFLFYSKSNENTLWNDFNNSCVYVKSVLLETLASGCCVQRVQYK